MSQARQAGRLRTLRTESALKRMGLRHFAGEDDPEASLIWAALAISDRERPPDDADAESLIDDYGITLPPAFVRLHRSEIRTRKFFTQTNEGARFGIADYGAIWSPDLRTGVFVIVDLDAETASTLLGFSYTDPLVFTTDNLGRLREILRDSNFGAAAGTERIMNHVPDLFEDSFFVDYYLDHHERCHSDLSDPFILIYQEFRPADEIPTAKLEGRG